jgi:hypothetical protein
VNSILAAFAHVKLLSVRHASARYGSSPRLSGSGDPLSVFFCGLSFDIQSSLFDILRFSSLVGTTTVLIKR